MPDRNFEKERIRQLKALAVQVEKTYQSAVQKIAFKAESVTLKGSRFSLSAYPELKKVVDTQMKKIHDEIYSLTINGIDSGWDLANDKNDLFVDKRLGRRNPSLAASKILYDPNDEAREAFKNRKNKGLNLSQRVWKGLEPFPAQLEAGLGLGISEGQPAAKMASDLKQYLKDPDKLFRRVRKIPGDQTSPLVLSQAAKAFHPGQGVYRSSYKNSLRLTRSEVNMAYRESDHERWQNIPFVVGFEIRLSNNHPKFDICDHLAGKYPKDFKWSGWHPQCLCNKVAIQMSDEEFEKYSDQILGLGTMEGTSVNHIQFPPPTFSKYVQTNIKTLQGYKSPPYWIRDNPQMIKTALQPAMPTVIPVVKPAAMPKTVPADPPKALSLADEVKAFTHPVHFETKISQIFEANLGLKPREVNLGGRGSEFGALSKEKAVKYTLQLEKLTSEYNLFKGRTALDKLTFESKGGSFGFVQSYDSGRVAQFNAGHKTDMGGPRTRDLSSTNFRGKSAVDDENAEIATVTHEFAHFITVSRNKDYYSLDPDVPRFWKEMSNLKGKYKKEVNGLLRDAPREVINGRLSYTPVVYKQIQELYLGAYADTNVDEFFAEGFTEYKLSKKPSKYAQLIGQLADKYFKKKK